MSNTVFHSSQVRSFSQSLPTFFQSLGKEGGYHPQSGLSRKVTEILKETGKSTKSLIPGQPPTCWSLCFRGTPRPLQAPASRHWKTSARLEAILQPVPEKPL